jgi:hypothetical protein
MTGPVFPEDSWVQVRYPLTSEQEHADRAAWPWLPGWVVSVCGPDEWEICVQAPELATWHDGDAWYPVCFRDSSEIRLPEAQAELEWPDGPELEAQWVRLVWRDWLTCRVDGWAATGACWLLLFRAGARRALDGVADR